MKPPCKGCRFRTPGCHAICEPYIEWHQEHQRLKEKDREEHSMQDVYFRDERYKKEGLGHWRKN